MQCVMPTFPSAGLSKERPARFGPRTASFSRCVSLHVLDPRMATFDDGRSMQERMLAGDLYLADDPEIAESRLRTRELMNRYNTTPVRATTEQRRLLEELLGSFGQDSEIRPPLYVDNGWQISIGARCFSNFGLVALDVATISI